MSHSIRSSGGAFVAFVLAVVTSMAFAFSGGRVAAESLEAVPPQETEMLKVGERLTYTLSLEGFGNVGFAELAVASRGKVDGRDAFEVRMRMKTFEIVNASFFPIDEVRVAYLDAASGLPFKVKRTTDPEGFPNESVEKITNAPSSLDIISIVYKVRQADGEGKFRLGDGDEMFWVEMKAKDAGVVRTEAGNFKSTVSRVRSRYFGTIGISDVKVYLSSDENRLPAQVDFDTSIGSMNARLTGYSFGSADTKSETQAKPSPTPFPVANPTRPRPTPTKPPYVENRPLPSDLPFKLGETLTFVVKNGDAVIGKVVLSARERKQVEGKDSLLLLGTVTEAASNAGIFAKDDSIRANVDPGSLLPQSAEIRFSGSLRALNFSAKFDQDQGTVTQASAQPIQIPSNTHTLLSLLYAVRTFNLKASKTAGNPVNDTRVSVLMKSQAMVFNVRPIESKPIAFNGSNVLAQQVGVTTGDPAIDALSIRVWVSMDDARLPLKISVGGYSAELLVTESRSK